MMVRSHRLNMNCLLVYSFSLTLGTIIVLHATRNSSNEGDTYILSDSKGLPLTMMCNSGRLGNQMCSYATLLGLSALNRRQRLVLDCNKEHLERFFVGPYQAESIKSSQLIRRNTWSILPFLTPEDAAIPPDSNIIGGHRHPCSFTFYDHVRGDILREFQFHEPLRQHAQNVLRQANVRHLRNVTYVGVHARRTDYNAYLERRQGVAFNMEYFRKALPYFSEKYKNVIFIGVSDDRQWCVDNLSKEFEVYVPPKAPTAAHDLAVLVNCNHTVMTYGTFGYWAAYLARGEVVYYDAFSKPNTTLTLKNFVQEIKLPPHWKGIATVNSPYWLKSR